MAKNEIRKYYNSLKEYKGQKYSGMRVGGKHSWSYNDGIWNETKITPDKWKFEFSSYKYRNHQAPQGSGAPNKTEFHWYIVADQKVVKLDANTYKTVMNGSKYKIAHKRPNFKHWSTFYKKELYEEKIIKILEDILEKLKAKKKKREILSYF